MNATDTQRASDILWAAWQAGAVLDALPDDCRPATADQAFAVQALAESRSSQPLFGWKIAATSIGGQQHIGVSGPLAGRLLHERVVASGATLSLAGNRMVVAEPEFAFRLARDLPARSTPYEMGEVLAAVAALHPAIEVPDSRYADFVRAGEAQLIADNACAHQFVIGPAAPDDWRAIDLVRHAVHAQVYGSERSYSRGGSGEAVLGDPRLALTWLANELPRRGLQLRAGQVVTTGTCMKPLEITADDAVTVNFGALGMVAVRFTQ